MFRCDIPLNRLLNDFFSLSLVRLVIDFYFLSKLIYDGFSGFYFLIYEIAILKRGFFANDYNDIHTGETDKNNNDDNDDKKIFTNLKFHF